MKNVKLVRVYMKESEHHVNEVLKILDENKIKHAIVLRAIKGNHHSAHILSLSLDLPLVLEFFDTPERIELVVKKVKEIIDGGHIVILNGEEPISVRNRPY